MHEFATLPQEDRADAVIVAAREKGMHPAIVEKDFWVCWTLDYLFGESAFRSSFAFKGGTSLSKGFNLIERFSEDIDLIFDWRLLGYGLEEPWEKRSNTKQARTGGFPPGTPATTTISTGWRILMLRSKH